MAHTQYFVAASLDGFIAEADDGLQWLFDNADDPTRGDDATYNAFYAQVNAIAVGATTYEIVARHPVWPYPGIPTWVFSHRDPPVPEGADVRRVQGAVADHAEAMLEAAGDGVLWVLGGGELASQFADAGLLDDLLVGYVPVVLGTGVPLFARRVAGAFRLVESKVLERGMVYSVYTLNASKPGVVSTESSASTIIDS